MAQFQLALLLGQCPSLDYDATVSQSQYHAFATPGTPRDPRLDQPLTDTEARQTVLARLSDEYGRRLAKV